MNLKQIFLSLIFLSITTIVYLSFSDNVIAASGIWIPTKSPSLPHDRPTATLLNDGSILVIGYLSNYENVEIYNPTTNNWIIPSNALIGYQGTHTATLLTSGEVLVTGNGVNQDNSHAQTAEIYIPGSHSWSNTGNMINSTRINSTAVLLHNGKVLVAGGGYDYFASSFSDTEIYDRVNNSWSVGPSMNNPRNFHTATVLPNGDVLVTGGGSIGSNGFNPVNTAEIYDSQSNVWIPTANMLTSRAQHRATLLNNGKVLVTGGFEKLDSNNYNPPLATAELYDPSTKQWTSAHPMIFARALHTATLLSDGRVLVTGGVGDGGTIAVFLNISEIYDPTTDSWTLVTPMNVTRSEHDSTIMQDGNVFTVGGINGLGNNQPGNSVQSAEIFNINSTPADFKQTDPQWSTLPSQQVNTLTHLDHSLSCGDMYGYGCAVTSVANVLYSYGKFSLPGSLTMQPGNLNDWLSINNGYSSCSIIWANASAATKLGAPVIMFRNNSSSWMSGQQAIDNALNEGNLPIVGVSTSFGTHFITLASKLLDVNGKPDYKIIDPALYPFVSGSLGKTGQSLSQAYGGWDKVFETVIYKKGSTSQKTLTIRAHSPVQLFITDPLGNTTGYDESTQEIIENIPDSVYGIESGVAPVDGSSPASEETKYFQQINPTEGEYLLQIIGTGDGSYALDFSKTDEQGNASTEGFNGVVENGTVETYHIQYFPDATISPVVNKEVTFQSTIQDINELFTLNLITQKSIANSLIRNIEQAQKASFAGDSSKIQQNLDQFLTLLDRNRGGKISERAYQILFSDVLALKNQN